MWSFSTGVRVLLPLMCSTLVYSHEIGYMNPAEIGQYLHAVNQTRHSLLTSLNNHSDFLDIIESLADPIPLLNVVNGLTSPGSVSISSQCASQVLFLFESFTKSQSWTTQLVDAAGKPGPAILQGHLNWLGDFDECMAVQSSHLVNATFPFADFRGQYCSMNVPIPGQAAAIPNMAPTVSVGVCVPEGCSSTDLDVMIYQLLHTISPNSTLKPYALCQKRDVPLTSSAITAISVYSIMGAICLIATIYDYVHQNLITRTHEKDDVAPLLGNGHIQSNGDVPLVTTDVRESPPEHGPIGKLMLCFSFYTNGTKLLSGKKTPGSLGCLHGIRFLSMCWVIQGHTIAFSFQTMGNIMNIFKWITDRWTFQVIMNATVSVDSFFVLSGLLSVYLMLKGFEKSKPTIGKFMCSVPVMYLHRYLRLTPAYGLMILFYSTVSFYFYEGPLRPQDPITDANCKNGTVVNMFYLNNIIEPGHQCAGWGWYLANDFQFFLITPFLAFILFKSSIIGLIVATVPILTSIGSAMGISIHYDYGVGMMAVRDRNHPPADPGNYMNDYYFPPWTRYQTFGIGVIYGFLLWKIGGRMKRTPVFVSLMLWAVSGVMMLSYLYGTFPRYHNPDVVSSVFEAALYQGLGRTVWAIALGNIILLCCTGNGGWVNEFLSWSGFIPLSRMTYCAYLVHPVIMYILVAAHKQLDTWTVLLYVSTFVSYLTISYAVAFLFSLLFEAPFMNLDKNYLTGLLNKRLNGK